MRRLPPSSPLFPSPIVVCIRCMRRFKPILNPRHQSTFLTSGRSQQQSPSPNDVSAKRSLSQLAGAIDFSSGPNWNALMHSHPPIENLTPTFAGISHDVLDKLFEQSPLWRSHGDKRFITPTISVGDPDGIQKSLLQCSPIPKNTVELLTVLDALIAKDDLGRAAMVVASLKRHLDPSAPLSTLVYNKYLEGVVSSSIEKNAGIGKAMEWYQEMERGGVKADRTTFALLSKAAFSLSSITEGNRAARKIFWLWKSKGGVIADLLCDLMFPQEEVLRSLRLNKLSMDDMVGGYREVLEIIVNSVQQTQTLLTDNQPSRDVIPAIRQTMSKSPNLAFMRKSLEFLFTDDKSDKSAQLESLSQSIDPTESPQVFQSRYDMARQRQLEEGAYAAAIEVWKHDWREALKRGDVYSSRLGLNSLVWDWAQAMRPILEQRIENIRPKDMNSDGHPLRIQVERETDNSRLDHIWLTALPVETLCAITITEVIRSQTTGRRAMGSKAATLVTEVGRAVEKEMQANDLIRKENKGLLPKHLNVRQLLHKKNLASRFTAKFHQELISGKNGGVTHWPYEWKQDVRARCGALLVSSLIDSAMVEMFHIDENGQKHSQIAPAFYHTYCYVSGKKVGVIKNNKFIAERFSDSPTIGRGITTKQAPMLVPPKHWKGWDEGGYWYTREEVMRTRSSFEQRAYLKEASDLNALEEVYRGLNVLGETAWTISRKMFDTVVKVWNSGESIADFPAQTSNLDYPVEPKSAAWDVKARLTWMQECKQMSRKMQNAHSIRCDINYKLEIARAFLGEKLYFPHSLDFRGRAYPVPPHFNHLGNDLCRGLLLFHEGKPLGPRGLRWLKIHLANLYGLDKMRLDEREEFAMNNLDEIFDSADYPLDGKRWWLNADDPWQCLATCFELASALRSPDPTAYVCHLPIHQDGSCNGLQHYAALGGDLEGAKQVNLEPADRPQDVYSGVAQLVAADIERQASEGNQIALALSGKVTRKTVKQTVMTSVYGVTFIGAKAQIYRALKDKGDIEESLLNPASDLIARSTFKCLKDMFKGANEIQEWLKECAKRITKSLGPKDFLEKDPSSSLPYLTSVVWTSPLGLPVCQPYRKPDTKIITTLMTNIFLANPNAIPPVNGRKQTTAFPPNFIHSLDASHMLMSAIACDEAGLTFASVHDSFWTHACDVDVMNVILREAFIRMHEGDLIKTLRDEFMERYKGHYYFVESNSENAGGNSSEGKRKRQWKPLEFPPIPKKGEFDVRRLKDSAYFFS